MPVDHSIYFQLQAPDLGAIGRGIESGMRMSDMMRQRRVEEKKLADQQAITDAYNSSQMEGGGFDDKRFMSMLGQKKVDGMTQMAFGEKMADERIKRMNEATKKLELSGRILSGVYDQDSYTKGVNMAINHGLLKPGELPEQYDPRTVQNLLNANMTAQERFKMMADRDSKDVDAFGRGVIVKRDSNGRVIGMDRDPNYQQPTKPLHPLEIQMLEAQLREKGLKPVQDRNSTIREYNAKGMQPEFNEAGQIIGVKLLPEEAARRALEEKKTNAEIAEKEAKAKNLNKKGAGGTGGGAQYIPGWQHDGKTPIDKTEVKMMRTAISDAKSLTGLMGQLKEAVSSSSTQELANPWSDKNRQIKNLLRDAQLLYKGEAFAKLGVLAGPDMAILEDVIENPTSIRGLMSGKEGIVKRYDDAISRINNRISNTMSTRGFYPGRSGGQPATGAPAPAPGPTPRPSVTPPPKMKTNQIEWAD